MLDAAKREWCAYESPLLFGERDLRALTVGERARTGGQCTTPGRASEWFYESR